ncbi:MAG: hypothetical protein HY817_01520 [Candidatus Abawacabacteria bacterium]|nr:hypothetical protein [Candidatus Abawacabacteria bacterium]
MQKAKSLLKSKTFWFNLLAAGTSIALQASGTQIDPQVQAGVLAAGNVLLRLITNKPISFGG